MSLTVQKKKDKMGIRKREKREGEVERQRGTNTGRDRLGIEIKERGSKGQSDNEKR